MSITLDPAELAFRRPFTQEVTQNLIITNNHHEPVAFKVKTTAPKQYCVRPNSGRIEAGQSVTVKVLLQAMKEDPPLEFKCRDKFLVQSVAITADRESQNAAEIWAHVDKNDKGAIQERKIRVVFLPPEGHEVHTLSSAPPSYHELAPSHPAPVSRSDSRPDNYSSRELASHASTPASSPPSSDLSAQLAEARQKIIQLQRQLAEAQQEGVRLRKSASVTGGEKREIGGVAQGVNAVVGMGQAQAPPGVSVKIVAALCLMSFLLALLF